MKSMNVYEFSQNNSGGSFDTNDKLCHRVFIEAHSASEANEIAISMGIYFDGCYEGLDCSCCGDRWYKASESDKVDLDKINNNRSVQFNTIYEYIKYLSDTFGGWTSPDARLFKFDGSVLEFYKRGNI